MCGGDCPGEEHAQSFQSISYKHTEPLLFVPPLLEKLTFATTSFPLQRGSGLGRAPVK